MDAPIDADDVTGVDPEFVAVDACGEPDANAVGAGLTEPNPPPSCTHPAKIRAEISTNEKTRKSMVFGTEKEYK